MLQNRLQPEKPSCVFAQSLESTENQAQDVEFSSGV